MITGNVEKEQGAAVEKPQTPVIRQQRPWQKSLAQAIRDPLDLLSALQLTPSKEQSVSLQAQQAFRLLVPHSYLARMRKGDWDDPLLRQVLPVDAEMQVVAGYQADPVADQAAMVAPGLLHKYQGRALLVTTGACAVHCRYCFRRHFPYNEANPSRDHWQATLDYIRNTPSLQEIILSGGDPLTLSDQRLQALCAELVAIPHIKRLRIHSRLPIVLPERIDNVFIAWLQALPLQVVMVVHANHAAEFAAVDVQQALKALRTAGIPVLNQAVLLRGVNDSLEALQALSEASIAQGVLPYYLNVLDKVAGAAHFNVPEDEALVLWQALRERVPGYLLPRLVRDVEGRKAKTLLI